MPGSTSELLTALVDQLEHGVWQLDSVDGRLEAANPAAIAQIGAKKSLLGTLFGDLLVPGLPSGGWRLLTDQIPTGGHHSLTVTLRRNDRSTVDVELTLARQLVRQIVVSSHDGPDAVSDREVVVAMTRRVDAAAQQVVHDGVLSRTIDALSDGVAVIGRDGVVRSVNPSFGTLVDVPIESIQHSSVYDPPWQLLDEAGKVLPPGSCPAATSLQTGRPAPSLLVQALGRGRQRDPSQVKWLELGSQPLRDAGGATEGVVLTVRDVSALRELNSRLNDATRFDHLTGLVTRAHVVAMLEAALCSARAEHGRRVGVLHVDLDNFRSINDTFGTTIGDEVLRSIGQRLIDLSDRHVVIGRLSVDEFMVVVTSDGPAATFDARLRRLADEIQRRVERQLTIGSLELRVTASAGVSRWPGDGEDASALQRAADRALTAGRKDGRQQVRFYERSLDEHTRTGLALDRDLRRAAAQRGMDVHFQPIIDLRTGAIAAAEALVRWHHPEHGPIPPSVFIPTAEATGAISAISDLVMTTVAENVAQWNVENLLPQGARIAVNISAAEFARRGFVERLDATLKNAGVSPTQIELEITETLLMNDIETTAARLTSLDRLGFLVALDDFGTGYSSLSYLHSLPLHTLKVDRCFVGDLRDGRSETITRAILSLAHGLGIVAVGEGVETDEQRKFLLDAGCDLVQGYLFAPPLPRAAFETFLRDHRDSRRSSGSSDLLAQLQPT